jgi:ABC-type transporter Mla subunit MlaD
MFKEPEKKIPEKNIPVRFLYEQGYLDVGQVERVEPFKDENIFHYKLSFRVTRPGAVMPEKPIYELALDNKKQYYLRVLPQDPVVVEAPDKDLIFTIENPLRMKRFLEIQLASAEALKITNEKVNQLLSDDTIATLNSTLKNTEQLTARATEVLDTANTLFQTSSRELDQLVVASNELAKNVTSVTNNVNDVIGNPQLKSDLISTVNSIQQSTKALSEVVRDPSLRETLTLTRDTSKSAAELVQVLKKTAQDKELQTRLDSSLTLLNSSLGRLSSVLANVDGLTNDKDKTLHSILKETKDTTENLKSFSQKLNGHFLLFRLMF